MSLLEQKLYKVADDFPKTFCSECKSMFHYTYACPEFAAGIYKYLYLFENVKWFLFNFKRTVDNKYQEYWNSLKEVVDLEV